MGKSASNKRKRQPKDKKLFKKFKKWMKRMTTDSESSSDECRDDVKNLEDQGTKENPQGIAMTIQI